MQRDECKDAFLDKIPDGPVSVVGPNEKNRVLTEKHVYEWTFGGAAYRVEIEPGFTYRPTTTPLPRTLITLFWGRHALEDESCAHDYTWKCKGYYRDGKYVDERVPKDASDAILLDGDDKKVLRHVAWALAQTVGVPLWHDTIKKAKAWASGLVT